MAPPWFDTHVHLDMYPEIDREGLLARAAANGVEAILAIGGSGPVGLGGPAVYRAVGLHPKRSASFADARAALVAELDATDVVAIGEVGFDRAGPSIEVQYAALREQVSWARAQDLTVALHIDHDWNRVCEPLRALDGLRVVRHYFTGTAEQAAWHAQRGHYLSFGRPLLKLPHLEPIAAAYPAGLLVIETDSYPLAGRRTEPRDVDTVGEALARIRGWSVDECQRRLWANSLRAFRL